MNHKPLNIRTAKATDFTAGQRVEYVEFDGTADPGTVSSIPILIL